MLNEISEIPQVQFRECMSQNSSWRQTAHTLKGLTKGGFVKGLFTKVWAGLREVQCWQQSVTTYRHEGVMGEHVPEPSENCSWRKGHPTGAIASMKEPSRCQTIRTGAEEILHLDFLQLIWRTPCQCFPLDEPKSSPGQAVLTQLLKVSLLGNELMGKMEDGPEAQRETREQSLQVGLNLLQPAGVKSCLHTRDNHHWDLALKDRLR